jgi:protein involved in polysaccharide export with SLBB domain
LEPPDIINVEAIHLAPRAPYKLRVFDVVIVSVLGTPSTDPIDGPFTVEPGGNIVLGSFYGSIKIEGLSKGDATDAIFQYLTSDGVKLINPVVSVKLARMGDMQLVDGNHTVGPDGYISLGSYGRVSVNGLTLQECKVAVESRLANSLDKPQVVVEVQQMNSKKFYIVTRHPGHDQVIQFPYTGNDTVMGALSAEGMPMMSQFNIKHVRPRDGEPTVTPLQWDKILMSKSGYGDNLQLLPDDRIFLEWKGVGGGMMGGMVMGGSVPGVVPDVFFPQPLQPMQPTPPQVNPRVPDVFCPQPLQPMQPTPPLEINHSR